MRLFSNTSNKYLVLRNVNVTDNSFWIVGVFFSYFYSVCEITAFSPT